MATTVPTALPKGAVGIFGGSFNPVHVGHVRLAEMIQQTCAFDTLWIVPNRQSPLKGEPPIDPQKRFEMVKLAFDGVPNTKISTFEMDREGPSYAIHTIEHIKKQNEGKPVYFILGTDAFYDLPEWYEFPRLLDECSYIVVTRAGFDRPETSPENTKLAAGIAELKDERLIKDDAAFAPFTQVFRTRQKTQICVFEAQLPEVSSTEIRIRLQMGVSIEKLVPPTVERYLKSSGLYVNKQTE